MSGIAPNLNPNNIPVGANVLPMEQDANPPVTANPVDDPNSLINKNNSTVSNLFNLAEMTFAFPMLLNSYILQAENISEQTKGDTNSGVFAYLGNASNTLSSVFKFLNSKLILKRNDFSIESNQSASYTQNFFKRFFHPIITKEFIPLLFNARRILFNFFPTVFKVPSAPHDPLHKDTNIASRFSHDSYALLAMVTKPLRFIASGFSALATFPSHLMAVFFSYTGNKEAYNATQYFNKFSEITTPLLSNLSSLLSVSKSYIKSFLEQKSKFVTQGMFHVSWPNMLQALAGGVVTSVPYFFGMVAKMRTILLEKDQKNNLKFSKNFDQIATNFMPVIDPLIKSFNPSFDSEQFLDNFILKLEKNIFKFDGLVSHFMSSLFNSTESVKALSKNIRPVDTAGNVQAVADKNTVENDDAIEYGFAMIKKSLFFAEIFDWLHPLQSMLMLLPNAFTGFRDPYIADNSKKLGRRVDRLLGWNSALLSLPNYLIYAFNSRIPQLMLKYFEYKDRQYQVDLQENQGRSNKKSGYEIMLSAIDICRSTPIFGFEYLASTLEKLITEKGMDQQSFADEMKFKNIYEELETNANKQETSVKASELTSAARIGFRTLLSGKNRLFFAKRDEATGLTEEEQSQKSFYDGIGKFKDGIGKIPILGWAVSPFLEAIRGFYKVDTSQRRNAISGNEQSLQEALARAQAAAPVSPLAA